MAQNAPTRVMTVDTQALVHSGIRNFLGPYPDLELVSEAYNGADAVVLCARHTPDVILVDIFALGPDWTDCLRRIKAQHTSARIVVLTNSLDGALVEGALQAGACGYLLKDVQALTLVQAIRSAAAGQQVLDPEATHALINIVRRSDEFDCDLSRREREVLTLLARGLANREIAARMFISTATVKFHTRSILAKLGVSTRAQAIVRAYERSLVPKLVPHAESIEHAQKSTIVGFAPMARNA